MAAPGEASQQRRRSSVLPLEALNPYTSSWTIRVRASSKGALRSVKTAKGESKVFSVELTDEQARARRRTPLSRAEGGAGSAWATCGAVARPLPRSRRPRFKGD